MERRKIILGPEAIPQQWYSILPDLPRKLPPYIDPETGSPGPGIVPKIYPKEILAQEQSKQRWIDIPTPVRNVYRQWRPTPLYRAKGLEEMLGTPAKIFYKYEGVSPAGSHKPNTAVAQAYYNKKAGIERLITETGAGQWGSALAFATMSFGLDSTVYMVRISYNQKPYRKVMMEAWNADVYPSPSRNTKTGREHLQKNENNPGSLGIAIGEAIEDALDHENTNYSLGSVLNHVLTHQTVIGQETKQQLQEVGEYPDVLFGCIGGGSSFSGLFWPFYRDKITGNAPKNTKFVATEPEACPSATKGEYTYDHGDGARLTPLLPMYTLGHDFVPPPIHAGGLRYHGVAPTLSLLVSEGEVTTEAYDHLDVFKAAATFMRTEGIIPAPEPAHAIKAAIDEAQRCKETGEEKTIVFLLCGHGHYDMQAYSDYFSGKLEPCSYPEDEVKKSIENLHERYPWLEEVREKYLREGT